MSILPIRIIGDPILHSRADEVDCFDSSLVDLVHDMRETMLSAPGVGLAGPQVGVNARVFVWHYRGGSPSDDRFVGDVDLHEDGVGRVGVVINPELLIRPIEVRAPDAGTESEGCLSLPGAKYPLVRSDHAVLAGFDEHGHTLRVEAWGWLARIFQHEDDHLDGTLYVDRLDEPWHGESTELIAAKGWGVPGKSWTPQG